MEKKKINGTKAPMKNEIGENAKKTGDKDRNRRQHPAPKNLRRDDEKVIKNWEKKGG
jgi:hypothetical protein